VFGSPRWSYDPTGSDDNTHRFTGKEFDDSVNLYYYGARYYDPYVGRFISRDPVTGNAKNPQSLNPYVYALNNPLAVVDPTGMIPQWLNSIIGTGVVIAQSILEGSPISTIIGIGYGILKTGRLPIWDRQNSRLVFENVNIPGLPLGKQYGLVTVLETQNKEINKHELVHLSDYRQLGGDLFSAIYLGEMIRQNAIGKDPYWDNYFERRARNQEGAINSPVEPIWGGRVRITPWTHIPLGMLDGEPQALRLQVEF